MTEKSRDTDKLDAEIQEPVVYVRVHDAQITLLGTAHVSKASAEKVSELLHSGQFDAVAVELCQSRFNSLTDPDAITRMDLFQVVREGKASMVAASLALGAYQQRLAEQFGINPGAEMRVAVEYAQSAGIPILLIDRDIGITLKRIYRNIPWWKRFTLIGGLMGSVLSHEEVSQEEIERLKQGDMLETTFSQFAAEAQDLFLPLIEERDRYMACKLVSESTRGGNKQVLAVVGAGHLKGMERLLADLPDNFDADAESLRLESVPPASRWLKAFPWLIVALVLSGFVLGFSRSHELGWELVADWVLINGGLSALGALIAGAHVITVVAAFLAAPLTSLNPTIGAGMVTAAVEIFVRKPKVEDFSKLRKDVTHWSGWRQNRVARVLLVFLLSTLGSAIGTYVAGFRIFSKLAGG